MGHDLQRPQPPQAVQSRKASLSQLTCDKCPSQRLSGRAPSSPNSDSAFAFACDEVRSFRTFGVSRLPNLHSLTTFHIGLNEGSFPPPALPGFLSTTSPSDSPP